MWRPSPSFLSNTSRTSMDGRIQPLQAGSRVGKFLSPEKSGGGNQVVGRQRVVGFFTKPKTWNKNPWKSMSNGKVVKNRTGSNILLEFFMPKLGVSWSKFDIPYFSDGLKSPTIGMVLDPAGRKNNSTRLVDEGFALLMVKLWRPGFGFCWFFLEISRVNESTNPEGWTHNGLLREMIQFDDHIFEMGWFNHQLGGFMRLYIHWNPQGVTTVSLCPRMASEWFQTLLP